MTATSAGCLQSSQVSDVLKPVLLALSSGLDWKEEGGGGGGGAGGGETDRDRERERELELENVILEDIICQRRQWN